MRLKIVAALLLVSFFATSQNRFGFTVCAPVYQNDLKNLAFYHADYSAFYRTPVIGFFAGYSSLYITNSLVKGGWNAGAFVRLLETKFGDLNLYMFDQHFKAVSMYSTNRLNFFHVNFNYELYILKNFISFHAGPSFTMITFASKNSKDPKDRFSSSDPTISLMLRLTCTFSGYPGSNKK